MNSFERSIESIPTYLAMMALDYIVLLENEKDMYFWKRVFLNNNFTENIAYESIASFSYIADKTRGKKNLEKFLSLIDKTYDANRRKELRIIICWDSDYDILLSNRMSYPMLVDTYGYTIENSLLCVNRITRFVMEEIPLNASDFQRIRNDFQEWFNGLYEDVNELLLLDIATELMKKEGNNVPSVMGKKSEPFMKKGEASLDINLVQRKIEEVKPLIDQNYVEQAKLLLVGSNLETKMIISGHFLENLVKSKIRKYIIDQKILRKARLNDNEISIKYTITGNDFLKRLNDKCDFYCQDKITCLDRKHLENSIESINNITAN